ncbi:MAG: hypothetical protein ILP19_08865, partial [Oscillospiraceae bacterium]|nr:hypothetical protein [Oscillospiraceae bacterium]
MTGTDQFQTAFGFSSLLICLTSLLFTAIQQRTDKEHNQIYIALIYTVFFNTLCSLGALFIEPMLDEAIEAVVAYQILHFLYFTLHNTLAPLFYIYVTSVCGAAFQKNKKRNILYISVFAVTELLLITNPVTKFVYYCDREHHFQRNIGEIFIYGSAVFFFILAFRRLLSSWNALTKKRRTALIYFFVLVVICIITQLLFPKITVELFGESLGLMGIMLSVETEDDKIADEAHDGLNQSRDGAIVMLEKGNIFVGEKQRVHTGGYKEHDG